MRAVCSSGRAPPPAEPCSAWGEPSGAGRGADPGPWGGESPDQVPGERRLHIGAPGGGEAPLTGPKVPPATAQAGRRGSWTRRGPLETETPNPSLQRPHPVVSQHAEGLSVHVCVCTCVCVCSACVSVLRPTEGWTCRGDTGESGPAGVAGILANPGRREGEALGTDSTAKSKRETTCTRNLDTSKGDQVGRSGRESAIGVVFLFY